jgi:hypothetical protein
LRTSAHSFSTRAHLLRWVLAIPSIGCAAAPNQVRTSAVAERPEDAIIRIASTWEAHDSEKGLRSSPSPIGSFDRQIMTRLKLQRGQSGATENVDLTESLVLRDGGRVHCSVSWEGDLTVAYGRMAGEPALELNWPALARARACDVADPVLGDFERPAGHGVFVLRSDQLVGIDPGRQGRTFLPVDDAQQ